MQYLFSSVFTVCFESNALIKSKENIFYTLKKTTSVTLSEHYCFNSFWQINITGNVIQSANLDLAKWRFGNDMKQKLKKKKNQVQNKNCAQPSFAQLTTFLILVIVKYGKEPQ